MSSPNDSAHGDARDKLPLCLINREPEADEIWNCHESLHHVTLLLHDVVPLRQGEPSVSSRYPAGYAWMIESHHKLTAASSSGTHTCSTSPMVERRLLITRPWVSCVENKATNRKPSLHHPSKNLKLLGYVESAFGGCEGAKSFVYVE